MWRCEEEWRDLEVVDGVEGVDCGFVFVEGDGGIVIDFVVELGV